MLVVGCAAAAAAGVALLVRGLMPSRPPLAVELDRLLSPTSSSPTPAPGWIDRLGMELWSAVDPGGNRFPALARDLAIMGVTVGRLIAQSIAMAVGGATLAGAVVTVLAG